MDNDLSKKESESFEHLRIKQFLLDNVPLDNEIESIDVEQVVGNRIADIIVKLTNGKKIGIEIQRSKIMSEEIVQRTKDYSSMGYHVLWILDGLKYDRTPTLENGIRVSGVEKLLHEMYEGRVYYASATKTGIQDTIFSQHFTSYQERKMVSPRFAYYRRSKTRKSLIPGTIPSYKLITFRRKGFKLARFTDESMKSKCVEEVSRFLNDSAKLLERANNMGKDLKPEEKLVYLAVALFAPRYGLHLLYNVLKSLKIVKNNNFSFLITVQEYLVSHLNKNIRSF